jgi:glycosyltransferase involved in cell wall biosynthesis
LGRRSTRAVLHVSLTPLVCPPRFGVFVHDPWKARKFSYGPAFALVYSFVEWLQKRMVRRCEHVITLSSYRTALVQSHSPGCRGKIIEGRILLRNGSGISESARSVVSIIGRINPSAGHDEFLSIAKDLRSKLSGISFEIVTSSPCATEEGFVIRANEAGVRIEFKPVLSEVEIEAAISRSVCVFRLDGELTQSGVLPLCYRLGIPVVARDIAGLAQHVIEGKTGYLLRPSTTILQLASWITEIRERQGQYRIDCRAAFQQDWAESAFDRYYSNLVGLLGRMS